MKNMIVALVLFCLSPNLYAQTGKVFDSVTLKSNILKSVRNFAIYLPPDYETSQRSYPVVYLLHGGGDNQIAWIQYGNVQRIVDKAIKEDKIEPMIIVMPDAEMTFYMNNINGNYQYEDFFIKELIPFIEKNYRCRSEKRYRALAGLSMGGFGSLLYALHHPDMFAACSAMSAAVRTDEQINEMPLNEYLRRYSTAMGNLKEGDKRINDFWNQNSILYLVNHLPQNQKNVVRFYLDIGDNDNLLYKGNALLHIALRDLNIPHEYRVRNGAHTWEYWRTGLPDALEFISESFR